MQLKMSLRGKDLILILQKQYNSIVVCMGEINDFCFLGVLVLLFFIDLAIHGKRLSCVPHLSKMSTGSQSYQNSKSGVKIKNWNLFQVSMSECFGFVLFGVFSPFFPCFVLFVLVLFVLVLVFLWFWFGLVCVLFAITHYNWYWNLYFFSHWICLGNHFSLFLQSSWNISCQKVAVEILILPDFFLWSVAFCSCWEALL